MTAEQIARVERLRDWIKELGMQGLPYPGSPDRGHAVHDALTALLAERAALRAALSSIAKSACCGGCQEAALVARAALAPAP